MSLIQLGVFSSRLDAICDEMGAVLRNAAFSPNIRDRLDFSCALFDAKGNLCAQAAHIPVHLGSMAYAMADLVGALEWQDGDQVVLNDPFMGGTHLPDVTLVAPLFAEGSLQAFVVNRAHHADIGASSPGSMPLSSSLHQEGLVIEPVHLFRQGARVDAVWHQLMAALANPDQSQGDFAAQLSANLAGLKRLRELLAKMSTPVFQQRLQDLNQYAARLAEASLSNIPDGTYEFSDELDDDGQSNRRLPIAVSLQVASGRISLDFSASASQVAGNVNCPISVVAAAVYYVFRCLMPSYTPACAGAFQNISIQVPEGSLLNARYPAAVAAGNVETSSRVVDVVMGALAKAIPERLAAASQGSMNNLAMGSAQPGQRWNYYETIGGGMGASQAADGLSGVQTHMTNTLNTPVEVLESRYPLRIERYQIRRGSGGAGYHPGGDGLRRDFRFLAEAEATLLTERRASAPWGLAGGADGLPGYNQLNGASLPAKCHLQLKPGDLLSVQTPGGGGWGNFD